MSAGAAAFDESGHRCPPRERVAALLQREFPITVAPGSKKAGIAALQPNYPLRDRLEIAKKKPMPRGGSKPGERRGGRQKGTPNKRSLPEIRAAIQVRNPNLDSLSLQRLAAAAVLAEINKLLDARKYDPDAVVDWCVKLARIAEGYTSFEHPRLRPIEREDRDYNVQVEADLSRLNAEQLLALKHLALIAQGGHTATDNRGSNPPDGPDPQRKADRRGTGKSRA
jgi:hypothetical protein